MPRFNGIPVTDSDIELERQKALATASAKQRQQEAAPWESDPVAPWGNDPILQQGMKTDGLSSAATTQDPTTRYDVDINGQRYQVEAPDQQGLMKAIEHLRAQPAAPMPSGSASTQPTPRFKGLPVEPQSAADVALNDMSALTRKAGNAQGEMPVPLREKIGGPVAGLMNGAMDALTLGFKDEIGAAADSAGSHIFPWRDAKTYDQALSEARYTGNKIAEKHPYANTAGVLTGALMGGAGLAKAGLSPTANAIRAGSGLGKISVLSGLEGSALGAAQGFGSGEGVKGRSKSALAGAALGGIAGGLTPGLVAGVSTLADSALAPIMARVNPGRYSEKAIGEALRRAGMSPDDVANVLSRAQADDQGMFTVADAMGNSGQRLLSTVARNPSDARQGVIEGLQDRQVGQGDRLASFLAEGFGAPDTAAKRTASLEAARKASARANYGTAEQAAGTVDPTEAIKEANRFLSPGVSGMMSPGTNIADDSIEAAVRRAKSYLTDGKSVLSAYEPSLRAKWELDSMIEKANPAVQRQLIPIRDALDNALADASPAYANARDTFRQQSKVIEAVDKGRAAASPRLRADDTIPAFGNLGPDEQQAFRAGYVDPLITRIEGASMAPTTNKARPLMTPKTGAEFPAFAVPGKADQLGDRIAREQRMFETANAALGGSKTADNLADAAELAKFDPGIMSKMMRGDVIGALMEGGRKIMNEASGTQPRVVEQIAKALMQTDPTLARLGLSSSSARVSAADASRARIISSLINSQAAGIGRLVAP